MADFGTCVEFAKRQLNFQHDLKEKQLETLRYLYEGRDVVSVLPTGYGKSVIFQLLPCLFQCKHDSPTPFIVMIICPLNSIMEDQVMGLREKGISACFISGSVTKTFMTKVDFDGDSSDEDETAWTIKDISFKDIANGEYHIIYAHHMYFLVYGKCRRFPIAPHIGVLVSHRDDALYPYTNVWKSPFKLLKKATSMMLKRTQVLTQVFAD